jgi:hypothetical protein
MNITEASIVTRRADILQAEVAGEVVLMSVERGQYYGLDPVGSEVWRRLAEPVPVAELCRQLLQQYDADPAVVLRDLLELLQRLSAERLIDAA